MIDIQNFRFSRIYSFPLTFLTLSRHCPLTLLVRLAPNGYVYETFGISKHFPIKLQVPLIRAEMLDNPLTAKCFIYDVVRSAFLSIIHWFAINFNNFHILIQQFSTLFSFQNKNMHPCCVETFLQNQYFLHIYICHRLSTSN